MKCIARPRNQAQQLMLNRPNGTFQLCDDLLLQSSLRLFIRSGCQRTSPTRGRRVQSSQINARRRKRTKQSLGLSTRRRRPVLVLIPLELLHKRQGQSTTASPVTRHGSPWIRRTEGFMALLKHRMLELRTSQSRLRIRQALLRWNRHWSYLQILRQKSRAT